MEPYQGKLSDTDKILQFLLFVDNRAGTQEQSRQVRSTLESLTQGYRFNLEVVNVAEQPHLTEHFKLIATPALIRLYPPPRQILAGTNLVAQLEKWWPRWQVLLEDNLEDFTPELTVHPVPERSQLGSLNPSAETLRLTDEVFQLQREKADLEAQVHFKDRIIAILAHDLRNPLTAAALAIDTLALSLDPNDSRQACITPELSHQLLQQARSQLRKLDHMVTDILQAARSGSRELLIQPDKLDLHPLCQEAIAQLKDRWFAKAQAIKTDIPKDLPWVYADRERIHQVLINLLDNAIKYTPARGTIQLSILHRTAQQVQISICDTGLGIPEEKRELIFEDTFRLERDENLDGYGIGLALCQRIVRAHYGHIWVDSIPDQGSCFHFTLPVYP